MGLLSRGEDIMSKRKSARALSDGRREEKPETTSQSRASLLLGYAVDGTTDAIGIATSLDRCFYLNKAFKTLVGMDEAQVNAAGGLLAVYADPVRVRRIYERILAGEPFQGALQLHSTRGPVWMEVRGNAVRDASGGIIGIVGVHTEITGQKHYEEALRESQEKWQVLFDSITDAVYVHRITDAGMPGRFIEVNDAACRMLGYTKAQFSRMGIDDIDDPDAGIDKPHIVEQLKAGCELLFEQFHVASDGRRIPVEVHAHGIGFGGETAVLSTVRDISERRKAEEERRELQRQLLHAQKMESVGVLAGGIAHDFNNILQTISGNAEMLMLDRSAADPDYENLAEIVAAGKKAADLTRRILTFSRTVDSEFNKMDLNREIKTAVKMLRRTFSRMIAFNLELAEDIQAVKADASQVEQVLVNLAVNARDAMPDGGSIRIRTRNVRLDKDFCRSNLGAREGDYVAMTVSDTGKGIEPACLDHIYEPFFTTKPVDRGTGLGLAIVYGIVKNHRGYITCSSRVGQGTDFTVYLPVYGTRMQPSAPGPAGRDAAGGTETILVVDDDLSVLRIAVATLERFGYRTLQAYSGEEAIRVVTSGEHRIDLILMDLNMPGMGGLKCLKRLLAMDPGLKIIVSSGYSIDGDVREVVEKGARGFVGKPYRISDMLSKIRSVLEPEPR